MRNSLTLSKEEVDALITASQYVVRLLVPDEEIVINDLIRGNIIVHGKEVDDQVLLKSDGFPTYHLANVVDDHLMKISHVIRGEEWLPSTPKHVILYNYFGWQIPEFAHLPLLLNPDKSKLSKRQGDVAVEDYISKGYFKPAFINFIALLGWNPTADREIFTIEELIELFNIEKVNKAGAVFDLVKLNWMNAHYLHHIISISELVEIIKPILTGAFPQLKEIEDDYIQKVISLFRERVGFVSELPEIASYMFSEPIVFDNEYKFKHWKDTTTELITELQSGLVEVAFDSTNLHDFVKSWCEEKGIKLKEIIHPIRLIITGKSSGAGMFETMEVLGKETCLNRFRYYLMNEVN
jgi:glutamyl-tRNA synthetase